MGPKGGATINAQKYTMSASCPTCTRALQKSTEPTVYSFTLFSILNRIIIFLMALGKLPLQPQKADSP